MAHGKARTIIVLGLIWMIAFLSLALLFIGFPLENRGEDGQEIDPYIQTYSIRQGDSNEPILWIQIVLTAFVDYSQVAILLSFGVNENPVDFVDGHRLDARNLFRYIKIGHTALAQNRLGYI